MLFLFGRFFFLLPKWDTLVVFASQQIDTTHVENSKKYFKKRLFVTNKLYPAIELKQILRNFSFQCHSLLGDSELLISDFMGKKRPLFCCFQLKCKDSSTDSILLQDSCITCFFCFVNILYIS